MEAKDFLEVAKRLQDSDREAERRTAISRAYYAVFNLVKGFLANAQITLPKDAAGHEKAHQYLLNSGLPEARKLADDLSTLRVRRNDADYELLSPKYPHDKNNSALLCIKAEQFFERLKAVDSTSLIKGIVEYKKKTNN